MKVRALRDVYYGGRHLNAGEEFETLEPVHATMMIAAQTVEEVQHISTEPGPNPADNRVNDNRRNRYNRRDMRARK